jgi:hypothetical protein
LLLCNLVKERGITAAEDALSTARDGSSKSQFIAVRREKKKRKEEEDTIEY